MEHISLVAPNFIIAPPQPGCPHSQCHLIRGKSLLLRRSVTRDLLIPGCVGIRDQDSPGQVATKTLRYQDIHLTKIFTRGQTIIFSFVNCF